MPAFLTASTDGIYSDNGTDGVTWTKIPGSTVPGSVIGGGHGFFAFSPTEFILVRGNPQIYRSLDRGATWVVLQTIGDNSEQCAAYWGADVSIIGGAFGGGFAQRSTDHFVTMASVGVFQNIHGLVRLASGRFLALINVGGTWTAYTSDDKGVTWTARNTVDGAQFSAPAPELQFLQANPSTSGPFACAVASGPPIGPLMNDANHDGTGVWSSVIATFSEAVHGGFSQKPFAIPAYPEDKAAMFMLSDGVTVHTMTTPDGITWTEQGAIAGVGPSATAAVKVFRLPVTGTYLVMATNGIYRSTDGHTFAQIQSAAASSLCLDPAPAGGYNAKTRSGDPGLGPSGLRFPRSVESLWGPFYGPRS